MSGTRLTFADARWTTKRSLWLVEVMRGRVTHSCQTAEVQLLLAKLAAVVPIWDLEARHALGVHVEIDRLVPVSILMMMLISATGVVDARTAGVVMMLAEVWLL